MIIILVGKELKGVNITVPPNDPETAHSVALSSAPLGA